MLTSPDSDGEPRFFLQLHVIIVTVSTPAPLLPLVADGVAPTILFQPVVAGADPLLLPLQVEDAGGAAPFL